MTAARGTIVKVGGSLLDLPDVGRRLQAWLAQTPLNGPVVFIVGCGPLGDTIRDWQQRFGWSDEHSHQMCVELLDISALALTKLLPELPLLSRFSQLQTLPASAACIFQPRDWLEREEPTAAGIALPRNWDVTTDSIAARLATLCGDWELVLLKSTLPAADTPLDKGFVDVHFARAAANLARVRFVNLRDDRFPEASPGP